MCTIIIIIIIINITHRTKCTIIIIITRTRDLKRSIIIARTRDLKRSISTILLSSFIPWLRELVTTTPVELSTHPSGDNVLISSVVDGVKDII